MILSLLQSSQYSCNGTHNYYYYYYCYYYYYYYYYYIDSIVLCCIFTLIHCHPVANLMVSFLMGEGHRRFTLKLHSAFNRKVSLKKKNLTKPNVIYLKTWAFGEKQHMRVTYKLHREMLFLICKVYYTVMKKHWFATCNTPGVK